MPDLLPLSVAPREVCILRLSALGDVTHTIPVVRAIQSEWPDCKITWVCGKFEHKLLSLLDNINFIIFDKKAGWSAYYDLWKQLRHKKFDVLLHMQVAARANLASACIKANVKLGWDNARSRDLHKLFVNYSIPSVKQQHQVEGFLSFARSLGAKTECPIWNLPITEKAKCFVAEHVPEKKPFLLISACSSHALRNWSAERYALVADYAFEKYGLQIVLSGGPSDLENSMAKNIQKHMKQPVINLVGKDTLEELLGLLSASTVVISPDSGPAHISNALGVKVIGLYACTWSKRSGPYNSLDYCVDKFELAAEKMLGQRADELFWGTRIEKPGVMELITVDEVCEKLDQVMSDLFQ